MKNCNFQISAASRWQFAGFDYAWGLQTLPSLIGGDVLLAGMASNNQGVCDLQNFQPSEDHYSPFLVDYSLGFGNNAISVTSNLTKMYLTHFGTGKSTLFNSYHSTRDWHYNNTWSANFATIANVDGVDVTSLTAPVWWWNNPGQ